MKRFRQEGLFPIYLILEGDVRFPDLLVRVEYLDQSVKELHAANEALLTEVHVLMGELAELREELANAVPKDVLKATGRAKTT